MKKCMMILLAGTLMLLCSCERAEQTWETVDDILPAVEAVSYQNGAYTIVFDIPDDAIEAVFSEDSSRKLYEQIDGDYEIEAQVHPKQDLAELVRTLSGFDPEDLQIVTTSKFGMPQYHFAWYTAGDEGGRLCRAAVLMDDTYSYSLTFSCKEDTGAVYDTTAEQVFSTLGLFYDENL